MESINSNKNMLNNEIILIFNPCTKHIVFSYWNWLIDYFQKFACLTCHTLYGWINNYWNFIVRDLDVDKKIVSCNICSSSLEKYVDVD